MILFAAFLFIFCMCEAQRTDLRRLGIKQHQIIPKTATTTELGLHLCEEGWKKFNGHCYLVVESFKTWDNANAYCEKQSSYLIEITTDEELEFVYDLIPDNVYYFWTGATDRETEGRFVYQHGQQLVPEKYWGELQPDGSPEDTQNCALMYGWSDRDFVLIDDHCLWEWNFICEKP